MARYHLYIGTYTQKGGTGIEHYLFDGETGGFALLDKTAAPNPSYLTWSPDGTILYACLEASVYGSNGAIAAFRKAADGSLTEFSRADVGGVAPCHLLVHPSGKTLYAANYVSGSLTQFALEPDGGLGERTLFRHTGHGPDAQRQEGPHAHCCVLGPKGNTLHVVDLGLDGILAYKLDGDGRVTGAPKMAKAPAGSGPRHLTFSKDGKKAYAVCELGNRVLTYKLRCGNLSLIDDQPTLPEDFTGRSACAAIRLNAANTRLYLTNRFHDTVATYAVDQEGMLTLESRVPTGGANPRDCALAPGEKFLLCAHQDSDTVTILRLEDGQPVLTPTAIAVSMPVAVLFGGAED